MKRFIFTLLVVIFAFVNLSAQIHEFKFPYSFMQQLDVEIPAIVMPTFDSEKLLKEDHDELFLKPYRFAYIFDVDINSENDGIWVSDKKFNIWFVSIKSENAFSLSLTFQDFNLPKNSKLFVYNKDKSQIIGALTSENNNKYNILTIQHVAGDEIIIEYIEPKDVEFKSKISISEVSHDYRDILNTLSTKNSGSCEINVNCEEGTFWQDVKKAVVKFTYNHNKATFLCTGTLISNIALTADPYLLTAEHCINNQEEANSAIFYFNYEATYCDGTLGQTNMTMSGGILKATGTTLDFTLLQLNYLPPQSYYPYFAGWNSNDSVPENTTCIHHPAGDVKKISIDNNSPVTGNFDNYYNLNTHWQILRWEKGATEGGSSGAPLFNSNKQIIGSLTGGEAKCGNPVNDYFQKFSNSWNTYSDVNRQLKNWLDPYLTGQTQMTGYDPYSSYGLPTPANLQSVLIDFNDVNLTWSAPAVNSDFKSDSFEDFSNFSLNFGNFKQFDADNSQTCQVDNFDFKNEGYTGSFVVLNPSSTVPPNQQGWEAHSGNKYLACFSSIQNSNNDWLISTKISVQAGDIFSFWAKSVSENYNADKFKILISDNLDSISSFTEISGKEPVIATNNWTNYKFDISDFEDTDIYIAINVVSNDGFCFLVDDISILKNSENKAITEEIDSYPQSDCESEKIETYSANKTINDSNQNYNQNFGLTGYNIYRNFNLVTTLPPSTLSYSDLNLDDGKYFYYVTAVYDAGISYPSNQVVVQVDSIKSELEKDEILITPNPSVDYINVHFPEVIFEADIFIYDTKGNNVYTENIDNIDNKNIDIQNLRDGIYILKAVSESKVFISKFVKN